MTANNQKIILPFASYIEPENKPLEDDVEKAVAYCLTELGRENGGGFFRKQPLEKIIYLTKVYYPFWLAPFKESTMFFDGLNLKFQNITYLSIPDPEAFKSNLNQRSTSRQSYSSFLSENINYFEESNVENTKTIDGLITDKDFSIEFMNYLKDAKTVNQPLTDGVIVSPANNKKQIEELLKNLEELSAHFEKDLQQLNEVIKLLNTKSQQFKTSLKEEMSAIEEKFKGPIKETKNTLKEKQAQINKEYNKKVTIALNAIEQESVDVHKEKIKLEKTKADLNSEIEKIENQIKTATINKDYDTEQKWKEKRSEIKKQIPELNDALATLDVKLQGIEERKKKELFDLKQEYDVKLKEAAKGMLEIEASRDAELKICNNEMEKIEELNSNITKMIDKLSKIREATIEEFKNLGIRQIGTDIALVRMPFYIICYQSKANKRCTYIAPSFVTSGGIGARIKAFGKMKITKMLEPRSQRINSTLNGFIGLMENNVAFDHEINEACNKADLLKSNEGVESIKEGLKQLKNLEWLSDSEFEFFANVLS